MPDTCLAKGCSGNILHAKQCPLREACGEKKNYKPQQTKSNGWVKKHLQIRKEEGLLHCPSHPSRVRDLICLSEAMCVKKAQQQGVAPDIASWYTDISQCASRRPWTHKNIRSITTTAEVFSHQHQRCISVAELFAIFGFQAPVLSKLSASQGHDLVGECMALPCITTAVMSVMVTFLEMQAHPQECRELHGAPPSLWADDTW